MLGIGLFSAGTAISGCGGSSASPRAEMSGQQRSNASSTAEAILFVKGLSCPLCATAIDKEMDRVAGVEYVRTNFSTGEIRVTFDASQPPSQEELATAVRRAGFTVERVEMPAEGA